MPRIAGSFCSVLESFAVNLGEYWVAGCSDRFQALGVYMEFVHGSFE